MTSQNPYQPPSADVAEQYEGGIDETSVFSPAGRFGRLSFLAWFVIVGLIGNVISGLFSASAAGSTQPGGAVLAAIAIVGLGTLVLYCIFSIRRCHDVNGSGWWVLLGIIPVINLFFFLFLSLKSGNEGTNQYAPPRVTPGWERVVGIIGIVFLVVGFIGMIAAIAIPAYTQYMELAKQAGG